jgi:uncharacterized membrane protein
MLWLLIVVTWLHVLAAIFWFGGTLYALFVLGPIVMSLPPQMQVAFSRAGLKRANLIFETLGAVTILLGIVRGTLLGPIQSPGVLLGTPYGITWGIALVLALGVLAWSHFVTFPLGERMPVAIEAGDTAVIQRAMPLIFIELAGFFAIFTCMILMRFGL